MKTFTDFHPIMFRRQGNHLFVEGEWPERITITKELIEKADCAYLSKTKMGDIIFTVHNGHAVYRKVDESTAVWLCQLTHAVYR